MKKHLCEMYKQGTQIFAASTADDESISQAKSFISDVRLGKSENVIIVLAKRDLELKL